jgi:1-acyl-sn-glycerol-3-phosphate acyltransferase
MKAIKAVLKIAAFLGLSIVLAPLQILFKLLSKDTGNAFIIPNLWHRGICKIYNIKIEIVGIPHFDDQTLFMGNHLSYLDIPVLGTIINHASFVAKKDVEGWPIFGSLAKLQNTAFIDRSPSKIQNERDKIAARVHEGHSLILFPEATSGDGYVLKPFKSSLFSLTETNNILIQPFTLFIVSTNGKPPETLEDRRIYTWPLEDDIVLGAHLWRFAKSSGACIRVVFHSPLIPTEYENRKALAKACENSVSMGLS